MPASLPTVPAVTWQQIADALRNERPRHDIDDSWFKNFVPTHFPRTKSEIGRPGRTLDG